MTVDESKYKRLKDAGFSHAAALDLADEKVNSLGIGGGAVVYATIVPLPFSVAVLYVPPVLTLDPVYNYIESVTTTATTVITETIQGNFSWYISGLPPILPPESQDVVDGATGLVATMRIDTIPVEVGGIKQTVTRSLPLVSGESESIAFDWTVTTAPLCITVQLGVFSVFS